MKDESILKIIKKYYESKVMKKYNNTPLDFTKIKRIGKNIIVDVEFSEDTDLSMIEVTHLWDDLYNIKDIISILGDEINSINFNPIFNYKDDE
jgi:hypothetical protein